MKYLSPRSDIGFKKLFGSPDHEKLTRSFLNSVLDRKEGNLITEIDFGDTEQLPENEDGRKSFFDIYCTDQQGHKFIIEMQRKYQSHFMPRAQYYTALSFYRQMHAPFKYEKLVPVIFIGVLDHILYPEIEDVISRHALMDIKNHTISSFHQMYHIIELPKFKKNIDQLDSDIDQWLFFMVNADELEIIPEEMKHSENFVQAFYILERMRWTEKELDEYLAEADAAGYLDRVVEGAVERATEQEKEKVAMNFLKMGISHEIIAQGTGLSIKEIEILKKEMKK